MIEGKLPNRELQLFKQNLHLKKNKRPLQISHYQENNMPYLYLKKSRKNRRELSFNQLQLNHVNVCQALGRMPKTVLIEESLRKKSRSPPYTDGWKEKFIWSVIILPPQI